MTRLLRLLCVLLACTAMARADTAPLDQAIALFKASRVPEARLILTGIVDREPDNVQALWYLGQANMKMQRLGDAADTLAKAAKLAPADPEILADYGSASLLRASELGTSFSALGYARRGRAALEQAVKLSPDNVPYREGLIQFYTRAPGIVGGSIKDAYAQIAEIAKRDPARASILKANVLSGEKRYAEALATCEDALRKSPDTYLALYTIGRIASESGLDLPRGEEALRRCLQLTPLDYEPNHAGAHYRLGMVLEKSNRLPEARAEYQAALKLEPSFDDASKALARVK